MTEIERLHEAIRATIDDNRLSRSERKAMRGLIEDASPTSHQRQLLRNTVFEHAKTQLVDGRDATILDWCEDMIGLIAEQADSEAANRGTPHSEALFSPGNACLDRIRGLISSARRAVDICVFTITDDRISKAIREAHERRVAVRIVTDVEKAQDLGSDIAKLGRVGVPIAVDTSDKHMHHKFAIFDGKMLLTGSFNWTRSAAHHNEENVVVSNDKRLVDAFQGEFDTLWQRFSTHAND